MCEAYAAPQMAAIRNTADVFQPDFRVTHPVTPAAIIVVKMIAPTLCVTVRCSPVEIVGIGPADSAAGISSADHAAATPPRAWPIGLGISPPSWQILPGTRIMGRKCPSWQVTVNT